MICLRCYHGYSVKKVYFSKVFPTFQKTPQNTVFRALSPEQLAYGGVEFKSYLSTKLYDGTLKRIRLFG